MNAGPSGPAWPCGTRVPQLAIRKLATHSRLLLICVPLLRLVQHETCAAGLAKVLKEGEEALMVLLWLWVLPLPACRSGCIFYF